jgi:uncharacterized membrane protein YGL010W
MDSFFDRQLATYASYHRDGRNRAMHFIGIPAIVFSILVPLALAPVYGPITCAKLVAAIAVLGWIALDLAIGLAMSVFMLPALLIAEWIARSYSATTAWIVFAVFFIGGWIFQLLGHLWEGQRPALADNLFQAFIGPMFIMAELLIACGGRRDLKAVIERAPQTAA